MMKTEIELLRDGTNQDINILQPEEMASVLGGATKCDQGYRHSLLYGTKCDCGYDNGHIQQPSAPENP